MSSYLEVTSNRLPTPWTRSTDGILAGVCHGLAKRFGVDPWLIRILWLVTILAYGTGFLLYVVLAFCLPREDRVHAAYDKRVLGVCSRLSRATGIDVGLVRATTVLLAFASFGATLLAYVGMYFLRRDRHAPVVL